MGVRQIHLEARPLFEAGLPDFCDDAHDREREGRQHTRRAALREELGLHVENQQASEPVLIIDKFERPTEN